MAIRELTALRGISGDERAVREYLVQRVQAMGVDVSVDRIGNVVAKKPGKAGEGRRVILAAHMDEVGFIVRGIGDDGLLAIASIGSIDPRTCVSKRVRVGKAAHPGVIGAKAIHLQTDDELKRVLPMDKLFIDIGAKDKAAAEKLTFPGDSVTFDSEFVEFGDSLVKSRALDDRVGCLTMLRALEGDYPVDLVCVFTVQEEIGLRGATAAGHHLKADCAIILEGTSANDLGMVDAHKQVCKVGGGVAISFMDRASVSHPALWRALRETAKAHGIAWQIKSYVSGGNDAGAFQRGAEGMPTAVLSVPCRYIHSPSSVASTRDIDAQYQLVDAFLSSGANF